MNAKILFIFVIVIFLVGLGGVSAVQLPENWFNTTTNSICGASYNITDETNSTDSNITFTANANARIVNSIINMTVGRFYADSSAGNIYIQNSTLRGMNGAVAVNYIYIRRNMNFTLYDSVVSNFGSMNFEGTTATSGYYANIRNSVFRDMRDYILFNSWYFVNITNNTFFNSTSTDTFVKTKTRENGYIFTNNFMNNSKGQGFMAYVGANGGIISNNRIFNIEKHGIVNFDSNYTQILNNSLENIGLDANGYGIDVYASGNHIIAEDNNINNASNGLVFSFTDATSSGNVTSKRNFITNIVNNGYCLSFSQIEVGGFSSEDDYLNNCSERGLDIKYTQTYGRVTNLTIINAKVDFVVNGENNVLIENSSIIRNTYNPAISFSNSSNITFKNISISQFGDYRIVVSSVKVSDINFSDFGSYDFYILNSSTDLRINLSTNHYLFDSINGYSNVTVYNLNNALVFSSNNSVQCINITSCDNTFNITTSINNKSYVLDNYNLTQDFPRQFSPIWFSSTSNTEKHIASNLTSTVTVPVIFAVSRCDNLQSVYYVSDDGSQTQTFTDEAVNNCNNNQVILNLQIDPATASNVIYLTYDFDREELIDVCTEVMDGFATFGAMASVLAIVIAILIGYILVFQKGANPYITIVGIMFAFIVSIIVNVLGAIMVAYIC